ncbi:hypothetical protein [Streptomyces kronopolitis]|uniref:hypothetical protein n=1 Tax=Streptomyces kronopolitis TaxID=1612435 RepID=UPI0020BE0642|nr:hypothetical protein [Streptomyces kronopolitis]MCL6296973.1 hypothetical protein [Streptomyces kronopolitis]
MKKINSWNRKFQVWQYSVSHSTLLLRSVNAERDNSRVDVLFPAVSLMHLKPSFGALEIHEADDDDLLKFLPESGDKHHGKLYLLNHGEAYVCAAQCVWNEDDGDHHSPSRFGPLRGTP